MILTSTDLIFDLFVGLFYVYSIIYSVCLLFSKQKRSKGVVILSVFLVITSLLYLFQTGYQYVFQSTAPVRIWDMYNLIQSLVNLIAIQTVSRLVGQDLKCESSVISKLPLA